MTLSRPLPLPLPPPPSQSAGVSAGGDTRTPLRSVENAGWPVVRVRYETARVEQGRPAQRRRVTAPTTIAASATAAAPKTSTPRREQPCERAAGARGTFIEAEIDAIILRAIEWYASACAWNVEIASAFAKPPAIGDVAISR